MTKLFTAKSIVQRDALAARLRRYGIEPVAFERDMSRKITENTLDLSLGGYSAISSGFPVFVDTVHLAEAERILAQFRRETEANDAEVTAEDPWRRYYACSIFSLMMPGLMTAPATYHLFRALRHRRPPRNWFYFGLATACFLVGWAGVVLFLMNLFKSA